MTDRNRTSGLERRAFLGGAAGMASLLAPRVAQAQAQAQAQVQVTAPAVPSVGSSAITVRTTEHLVGSAVNHAYAVKAGPFVFLNGHEGFDFAAGVTPAVAGAEGFPDYGKPGMRREADFILERMEQILKSFGTDLPTRCGSTSTTPTPMRFAPITSRALPRFGKYVPPSTSMIMAAASAQRAR